MIVRRRLVMLLGLITLLLVDAPAQDPVPALPATSGVQVRYQSEIEEFLRSDSVAPPPHQGILFIGSSIFRQWSGLRKQMVPLPVFNRAFGGSRTDDILRHMSAIVLPYAPEIIVYYCGSNDVNAGFRADSIADRFFQFRRRVGERLPATRIFYVSIIRAPQKEDRWNVVDSANALVREFCAQDDRLLFVDVNPLLVDAAGEPREECYQSDRLHLTSRAYEELAARLKPLLENAVRKGSRPAPDR